MVLKDIFEIEKYDLNIKAYQLKQKNLTKIKIIKYKNKFYKYDYIEEIACGKSCRLYNEICRRHIPVINQESTGVICPIIHKGEYEEITDKREILKLEISKKYDELRIYKV